MNIVTIIPVLNPHSRLVAFVDELKGIGLHRFIVVDDGSGESYANVFETLKAKGIPVVHHPTNLGKGAAIKTALTQLSALHPDATGYVTVDGDGQHRAADVARVCALSDDNPGSIVLGVRDFQDESVPLRSRVGNKFSAAYFKADTGVTVGDTQTGLRCFPRSMVPFCLSVAGARYEYEMNLLTAAAKRGVEILTTPIQTVYVDGNAGSHFDAIRDSARIYKQLLKFAASSATCSAIDLCLFALMVQVAGFGAWSIAFATAFARVSSGMANFAINRTWSFKGSYDSDASRRGQALRYAALFTAQLTCSSLLVTALAACPIPLVALKVIVDTGLFFASYFIQRNWVFSNISNRKERGNHDTARHAATQRTSTHMGYRL